MDPNIFLEGSPATSAISTANEYIKPRDQEASSILIIDCQALSALNMAQNSTSRCIEKDAENNWRKSIKK